MFEEAAGKPQAESLRVLSADRAGAAQAWSIPQVEGLAINHRRESRSPAELEEQAQALRQRGFDEGHAAGLAAARAEIEARLAALDRSIARFDAALAQLAAPLARVDAEVEHQLVQLALMVAAQLVRRELRIDPAQVIAVIRDTVALLPIAACDVRVHLHPEDAAIVRERLAAPQAERAWTLIEDPVLARGGCRVATETSEIDARLETRLRAAIAHVLGEERTTTGPEGKR